MVRSKKEIVLEVLQRAFIDRDPAVVDEFFGANYKQHNPRIADGPSAIAKLIPTLTARKYEPGMAVADGDLVMVGDPNQWLRWIYSASKTAKSSSTGTC